MMEGEEGVRLGKLMLSTAKCFLITVDNINFLRGAPPFPSDHSSLFPHLSKPSVSLMARNIFVVQGVFLKERFGTYVVRDCCRT